MNELPFAPYEGPEPYIFVSYAHKNKDKVYPIIKQLHEMGYRLWYDEGIEAGDEWPATIHVHLRKASCMLLFLSPEAVASKWVKKEINVAVMRDIHIVGTFLTRTELPDAVEYQLSDVQMLFYERYADEKTYLAKLKRGLPEETKQAETKPAPRPVSKPVKRVLLVFDETFDLDRVKLCQFFNKQMPHIGFRLAKDIQLFTKYLAYPVDFSSLRNSISDANDNELAVVITDKPFINNYFFSTNHDVCLISFSDWKLLTNLSKNNGIAYFIADLLALGLDNGFRHDEITGCIYDFREDKRGIDTGMRQACFCPDCLRRLSGKLKTEEQKIIYADLKNLLNAVAAASKWNEDIIAQNASG